MVSPQVPGTRHDDDVQRRRWHRLSGDRGAVTVELAVVFPLFLVLLLSAVQAAMWWHARNIAIAAANEGMHAGRQLDHGETDARQAALSFTKRAGGDSVHDVTVSTGGSTDDVLRVEVSATATRVLPIPGLDWHVTQSVAGEREKFTTPGDPP